MFKKFKEKRAQLKKLKDFKRYYKVVKAGQLFIEFIQQDIAQQKREKMNRHQRRRFEKQLSKDGQLTPEIVQTYKLKIDNVLRYIEMQTNPPKIKKQKLPKIKEGKVKKGGVNDAPTTPAPEAPKGQGKK